MVHVDLIGPYTKSRRPDQPGGAIIRNNVSLTFMTMTDPATGWFEIFEIPTCNLDEVTGGNDEYIDKSSDRFSHLFHNTWLCRYLRPQKDVFDRGSDFKQDFTPLLKNFDIKPVLTKIKTPQANAPLEQVSKAILNIPVTKYLDNKIFDHKVPWGETLASIVLVIRYYYNHAIIATPD